MTMSAFGLGKSLPFRDAADDEIEREAEAILDRLGMVQDGTVDDNVVKLARAVGVTMFIAGGTFALERLLRRLA